MANLQKLIDLDGLSYFLGQIKTKFVRSVNGVKPDSKGNVDVPQISANEIVNIIYPVGSLYWSKNATDPSELFGGIWTQIKDKFILAAGDTYLQGTSGGAATVTLTTEQIPSHTHTATAASDGAHDHTGARRNTDWKTETRSTQNNGNIADDTSTTTSTAGAHTHKLTINSAGGGAAHNNMPPYATYYCWERTA